MHYSHVCTGVWGRGRPRVRACAVYDCGVPHTQPPIILYFEKRGQAHSHREKRRAHCRRCIRVSCVRQVFGRGASGSCGGGGRGGPLALARVAVATVSFLVCPRGATFRLGCALLRLRRCGRLLAVGCGLLHLDLVRAGIRVRVGIVVRVGVGAGVRVSVIATRHVSCRRCAVRPCSANSFSAATLSLHLVVR